MDHILTQAAIDESLKRCNVAWTALGNDYLVRVFTTADFAAGVALLVRIAAVAEREHHHPEITLTINRLEVRVATHSVAGITEKDFAFARAIDAAIDESQAK